MSHCDKCGVFVATIHVNPNSSKTLCSRCHTAVLKSKIDYAVSVLRDARNLAAEGYQTRPVQEMIEKALEVLK